MDAHPRHQCLKIDARKIEKTKLDLGTLANGLAFIPHPTHTWEVGTYSGGKPVSWKGTTSYYSSARAPYGMIVSYLDKPGQGFAKAMDVITGPGTLS